MIPGDTYRAKPVGEDDIRHVMFIIAENDCEYLVVPMDTDLTDPENYIDGIPPTRDYPQMHEFKLSRNQYGFKEIKHPSYVNYGRADIIPKTNILSWISDYDIDPLDSIKPEFLAELRTKGLSSRFIKKKCKQFLIDN